MRFKIKKMKKVILLLPIIFLFFSTLCTAQYESMMGAIFDDKEAAASEAALLDLSLGTRGEVVTTAHSLKPYAPTPRKQNAGTCVGYALSNAVSIMFATRDSLVDKADINANVLSALYIYNQIQRRGCDIGARITDAMALVKNQGGCTAKLFPDTDKNCQKLPDDALKLKALDNRIKDYISIFPRNETDEEKVALTKKQLLEGRAVVIGMNITQSFFLVKPGDRYIDINKASPDAVGGHAMCIVGYDDHREAFEIMNSWGKDWGNEGFIWMKYDDFAKYVKYGYAPIIDELASDQIDNNITMKGEFAFRYPAGFDENSDSPMFKEMTPTLEGNNYVIADWKVRDVYQLLGRGMTKYSYTYVFSIDAENKAELHFPRTIKTQRTAKNDPGMDAADEVPIRKKPLNMHTDDFMIIPGEFTALQAVHKGTDNIFVIYSHEEIPDIQKRMERVQAAQGKDINKRLKKGFDDIFIPRKNIKYSKQEMSFTATSDKGIAVPIVLEIVAN